MKEILLPESPFRQDTDSSSCPCCRPALRGLPALSRARAHVLLQLLTPGVVVAYGDLWELASIQPGQMTRRDFETSLNTLAAVGGIDVRPLGDLVVVERPPCSCGMEGGAA